MSTLIAILISIPLIYCMLNAAFDSFKGADARVMWRKIEEIEREYTHSYLSSDFDRWKFHLKYGEKRGEEMFKEGCERIDEVRIKYGYEPFGYTPLEELDPKILEDHRRHNRWLKEQKAKENEWRNKK